MSSSDSSSLTFADKAISFFSALKLQLPQSLDIQVMNPYQEEEAKRCIELFFKKFFNDHQQRIFLFGINPGRLGGGLTGISFTDPVILRDSCGIENDLGTKRELSSEFIYKMIEAFGGTKKFYQYFFLSAVCPLGFMKGRVNYNYYDDSKLQESVTPFIRSTLKKQVEIGARKTVAICIGAGKNRKLLELLNKEGKYFEKIISLDHPRFIMQYRRKKLETYIHQYVKTLEDCILDSW